MKKQQINKKSAVITFTGVIAMMLMTVTKAFPSFDTAGYSVFVGIAFFFIAEAAAKTERKNSGLRFNTIPADLKKRGVIPLMLLPVVSGILTVIAGDLIFRGEYKAHILGRAGGMLAFDKIALLIVEVVVAAFGEEIAYRGFFFGKTSGIFPIWLCAVVSSLTFAAGHIAAGNMGVVLYDVACVFIDSLIFSAVYYRSGNCLISTFSHILANSFSLVVLILFLH